MPNLNDDYYGYSPYKLAYEHPSIHGLFVIIRGRANITDKATGKAKGYCITSIGGFAKEMNVSKQTVITWKNILEKEGYIRTVTTGRGKVNKIYPLWNYDNVSMTSEVDLTSKADLNSLGSKADLTSKADLNSLGSKVDLTSKADLTQLVKQALPKDKYIELNNNIYANNICVNASCDDVQNNDIQNAKEALTQKEASDTLELLFAEWYSSYPRKKDKQGAKKAFLKVMKLTGKNEKEAFGEYAGKPPAEKVAMMKQVATRQARETEPQYIPYPSTWLNGCRWQDSTDTAPTSNSTEGYSKAYADEFGV
ncbi:MAG: helix-turn-helix domain-containing protein [Selenomonadaceae bacterium]|nr:helix-turn-helix domain-containing protein [Selenomonadaceae bacterium]